MRWRYLTAALLVTLPVCGFIAAGVWAVWQSGQLSWLLWGLPVCWGIAFLLARRWSRRPVSIAGIDPPRYWTARDRAALELVEVRQQAVRELSPDQLVQPRFYLDTAIALARDLARHYHPKSKDPLGSVTVVEILAVAELAIEESAKWVDEHVPGSHLLTVAQWRMLAKAPGWVRNLSDLAWLSSLVWNPSHFLRHATMRMTGDSASRQFQANVLAAFYVAVVRFAGFYLIEMNSGRLRGGAERYRRLQAELRASRGGDDDTASPPRGGDAAGRGGDEAKEVTIALVGQVNAGKSSLVNALLGEKHAAVDVLPKTRETRRYRCHLPDSGDTLVLLDTPGYGEDGATERQAEEIRSSLARADLVLLVMNVTQPARKADVDAMSSFRGNAASKPHLKLPPVVGVLTHIDALRPVMEWSPPYAWQDPADTKEFAIHDAVAYNQGLLEGVCDGLVPACTDVDRDRVYGVREWLEPVMVALLEEARACSLIRSLHADLKRDQVKRVANQIYKAGWQILKASVMDLSARDARDG